MKRIWLIYPYGPVYGDKGKECRYTQFGRELDRAGYQVIWWTANFSHGSKTFRCDGWKSIQVTERFETRLVPTSEYKKNISFGRIKFEKNFSENLAKGFNDEETPDAIVVASTGMFNAFEPCITYAISHKIPIIYDIMDIPLIEFYMQQHHKLIAPIAKVVMGIERMREKKFFKTISGICALGKNQLEYAKLRAFHREIPACLVYNGIEVNKLRKTMEGETPNSIKSLVKEDGWVFCVFSGSLGPSYDIEAICQCAQLCEKKKSKVKFLIAGKGPQADLVKETSMSCANLEYVGFVSLDELAHIYRISDIGLCAFSEYSTVDMPDKFYDYCAGGLAVLNTLKGEVKEYIEDNNLGYQYKAGDANDLYEQVMKLSDPAVLAVAKENSYKIGGQFDILEQVKKLSTMVSQILHN